MKKTTNTESLTKKYQHRRIQDKDDDMDFGREFISKGTMSFN